MFNILFIDDNPQNVEAARRWLMTNLGITSEVVGFSDTEAKIKNHNPDMIVLDLFEGAPDSPNQNWKDSFDKIWSLRFRPIIIYSANPDAFTGPPHPFIKKVQKGKNSVQQLETEILSLKPHIDSILEAEDSIDKHFSDVLRDVAPRVFDGAGTDAEKKDIILRSGRRRLAAMMDDQLRIGSKLVSWERYLCPPISSNLKLGDLLRRKVGGVLDPLEFRLVLTPSCDLVPYGGKTKVKNVLVAKCFPANEVVKILGLSRPEAGDKTSRIGNFLSQGFERHAFPLPAFSGKIPLMIANLKELELIPIGSIGKDDKDFEIIASVDSPFRELVSWAYMSVASRPGVPECDYEKWRDEILATMPSAAQGGS